MPDIEIATEFIAALRSLSAKQWMEAVAWRDQHFDAWWAAVDALDQVDAGADDLRLDVKTTLEREYEAEFGGLAYVAEMSRQGDRVPWSQWETGLYAVRALALRDVIAVHTFQTLYGPFAGVLPAYGYLGRWAKTESIISDHKSRIRHDAQVRYLPHLNVLRQSLMTCADVTECVFMAADQLAGDAQRIQVAQAGLACWTLARGFDTYEFLLDGNPAGAVIAFRSLFEGLTLLEATTVNPDFATRFEAGDFIPQGEARAVVNDTNPKNPSFRSSAVVEPKPVLSLVYDVESKLSHPTISSTRLHSAPEIVPGSSWWQVPREWRVSGLDWPVLTRELLIHLAYRVLRLAHVTSRLHLPARDRERIDAAVESLEADWSKIDAGPANA